MGKKIINKSKFKKKKQQQYNISKWKFKKFHFKLNNKNNNNTNYYLSNKFRICSYGIRLLESGYLYSHQLKAMRDAVKKFIKGKSILRTYFSCNSLLRKKKTGMRMGKGKGPELYWVKNLKAGSILLEVSDFVLVKKIFKVICKKSPLKLKVINIKI